MKKLTATKRNSLILLALFPTLWGLFSLLNNISGFSGTLQYAVYPLLNMSNTYGNPAQTWRAIDSMGFATIGLIGITITEALAGFLGLYALIKMLKTRQASYEEFVSGIVVLIYACLAAIAVWGIGFMVVAGDWFLAWQAKENPLNTQLGGMIYSLPCFLTLITCFLYKEEK